MKKFIVNQEYANRAYISDSLKESILAEAIKDGRIESVYRMLMEGVNPNAALREEWTDGFCHLDYPIGCPLDIATSSTIKRLLKYFGASKKMFKKHYDDTPDLPDYAKKWERTAERKRRKWLKEHIPEIYST